VGVQAPAHQADPQDLPTSDWSTAYQEISGGFASKALVHTSLLSLSPFALTELPDPLPPRKYMGAATCPITAYWQPPPPAPREAKTLVCCKKL
jgi:hypothetical protein